MKVHYCTRVTCVVKLFVIFFSVKYINSQKGKKMILFDRHTYTESAQFKIGKKRWTCSTHMNKGCKAFIYTFNDVFIRYDTFHTHLPKR